MKNLNRESLKAFFQKGKMPTEMHFGYLIDSMVNKVDDGFDKTDAEGLQLSPKGATRSILSIYKAPSERQPSWQIGLESDENGTGLSFDSVQERVDGGQERLSRLTIADNGNIGIGVEKPNTLLDVNGTLSAGTRVGTLTGRVPGNGTWHSIISDLDSAQAFEAIASIEGPPRQGKHAMTHAIALTTFGGSRNRLRQTCAHYGWFWNRIEFRWHGATRKFSLQVRTRTHYGMTPDNAHYMIQYHVTRLWDPSIFPPR